MVLSWVPDLQRCGYLTRSAPASVSPSLSEFATPSGPPLESFETEARGGNFETPVVDSGSSVQFTPARAVAQKRWPAVDPRWHRLLKMVEERVFDTGEVSILQLVQVP